MTLDSEFIRRRRQSLALTQRQVASAAGTTTAAYARMEDPESAPDPRLSTLTRLAAALGCSPHELLGDSTAAASGEENDTDSGDHDDSAAHLGHLLAQADAPLPVEAVAELLEITLDDVEHATAELRRRLDPCGMVVHELHRTLTLRPREPRDEDRVRAIAQTRAAERGLSKTEAALLHRAINGLEEQRLQRENDRLALASLRNLGAIDRSGTPTLTDDARYSLGLHE